jgi:hypothetical protein
MRSEFLSKNDNSGGKTPEASEGVEYDIYCMEYEGSGNMKMYSPMSIIFPSGVAFMEYDTLG